jgi:hypothetical protein
MPALLVVAAAVAAVAAVHMVPFESLEQSEAAAAAVVLVYLPEEPLAAAVELLQPLAAAHLEAQQPLHLGL